MLKKNVLLISFLLFALIQVGLALPQQTEDQSLSDTSSENKPWQHILLQQRSILPYQLTLTKIQYDVLQDNMNKNPKVASKFANTLQELRSRQQNDSSKLAGLVSLGSLDKRKQEDSILTTYVDRHEELKNQYATLFPTIDSLYRQSYMQSKRELWLSSIYPASSLLRISASINKFKRSLKQQSQENKSAFYSAHVEELKIELTNAYATFDLETERQMLRSLIIEATRLAPSHRVLTIQKIASKSTTNKESINRFVNDLVELSRLKDPGYVLNRLLKSPVMLANYNDALLLFEIDLDSEIKTLQEASKQRNSELNTALTSYLQLKTMYAAQAQSAFTSKP